MDAGQISLHLFRPSPNMTQGQRVHLPRSNHGSFPALIVSRRLSRRTIQCACVLSLFAFFLSCLQNASTHSLVYIAALSSSVGSSCQGQHHLCTWYVPTLVLLSLSSSRYPQGGSKHQPVPQRLGRRDRRSCSGEGARTLPKLQADLRPAGGFL